MPIAVVYKYVDDSGGYLAALITHYAFVSLFPLLLLLTTVLGLRPDRKPRSPAPDRSVGAQSVPGHRRRARTATADSVAAPWGCVVGVLGALYGGLGVAQATQYAMNAVWSVPRNERPNPIKGRGAQPR